MRPVREPDAGKPHVRLCVQKRLARSVGVGRPTEARVRSLVAWMAGWRETKTPKPIGNSTRGVGSESSGRNESERMVASKVRSPRSRARNRRAKAVWSVAA